MEVARPKLRIDLDTKYAGANIIDNVKTIKLIVSENV